MNCDWCGYPMDRIQGHEGTVHTSFWKGKGSVWLCRSRRCGHEIERPDAALPLAYWRDELVMRLLERYQDLRIEKERRELDEFEKRFAALMAETNRLLSKGRVDEYKALFDAWMKARADSGDTLTEAQESEWMGRVDRVWTRLDDDERDECEAYAMGHVGDQ